MAKLSDIKLNRYEGTEIRDTAEQNVGNPIEYVATKAAQGFTRSIEGMVDFVSGIGPGIYGAISGNEGAKDFAKNVFTTDWFDYSAVDKQYNPSAGMQFVGEVASGIGNSLPSLLTAGAAGVASGLAGLSLSEATLRGISLTALGYSATGNAIGEAINKTGEFGGKELGYGLLSGITEVGTEAIGDALGLGTGRVMKSMAGRFATDATEAISKSTAWGIVKSLGGDFLGEGFEEGLSAILEPAWGRITGVDPNAEWNWGDIGYQALIGGLSGVMMGAAQGQIDAGRSIYYGKKALAEGKADRILDVTRNILENGKTIGVSDKILETVQDNYDQYMSAVAKTNGKTTVRQQMLLGNLTKLNTAAMINPLLQKEALNILQNAEAVAEQYSAFMKDSEGNPVRITAADIRKGVNLKETNQKTLNKQIRDALMNNQKLQGIAIMSFAGKLYMQTDAWVKYAAENPGLVNQSNLGQFVQTASEAEKAELGRILEISDWNKVSPEEVNEAFRKKSDVILKAVNSATSAKEMAKGEKKTAPKRFTKTTADGAYDIGDGYTVVKQGDSYRVYNAQNDSITREIGVSEVNALLNEKTREEASRKAVEEQWKAKEESEKVEEVARRAVENYDKLSETVKNAVRMTIRQASANGVSTEEMAMCAKISANTGLNVVFSLKTLDAARNAEGKIVYADAQYDLKNTVYVNPTESRTKKIGTLQSHELAHWIWQHLDAKSKAIVYSAAVAGLGTAKAKEVMDRYEEVYSKTMSGAKLMDALYDEVQARYAEDVMTADGVWDALLSEDASLQKKAPAFVKEWAKKTGVPDAVKVANVYAKAYMDAFRRLSAYNKGANAYAEMSKVHNDVMTSRFNIAFTPEHQKKLQKANYAESIVKKEVLLERYKLFDEMWKTVSEKVNSDFLKKWSSKKGEDRAFSIFKQQLGYKINVEFSTECAKGLSMFDAIDKMVQSEAFTKLNTKVLAKPEKQVMYDVLSKWGFKIPCAVCYVEQARQREGKIIDEFLNGNAKGKMGWNTTLKQIEGLMKSEGVDYTFPTFPRSMAFEGYKPNLVSMTEEQANALYNAILKLVNKMDGTKYWKVTPELFNQIFAGTLTPDKKILQTLAFEDASRAYIPEDFMYSSIVTENIKKNNQMLYALFNIQGGQNTYKTKQRPVVYWGDMLKKTSTPDSVRRGGGARSQSNSDFQMYLLYDYVQMLIDDTVKGYTAHLYAKVPSEFKLLGLSGVKMNASAIPAVVVYKNSDGTVDVEKTKKNAGLDENGDPIYDYVEGINMDEMQPIIHDPEYSKDCGIICIGFSDKHIDKLLDDDNVQLIIGFHDTQDNPEKRFRGAEYAHNYRGENEAIGADGKTIEDIKFSEYIAQAEKEFGYDFNTEKHTKDFVFYTTVDGKTETYDFDHIPELAVEMYRKDIHKRGGVVAYPQFEGRSKYYKLLGDFRLKNSEGHYAPHRKVRFFMPETVPVTTSRVVEGKKKISYSTMNTQDYITQELSTELETMDKLSYALDNGMMDEIVDKINKLHEDENVASKATEKRHSLPDQEYMDAVNSGDMETAQRLVDEAARNAEYTIKAYHGTANGGKFNFFDPKKLNNSKMSSHIGQGFYFTNSKDAAIEYTKNIDVYGKRSKGKNPNLFEGYIKLQKPIEVTENSHNLQTNVVKNIFGDGDNDWFFEKGIAHYLAGKDINGQTYTKEQIEQMTKAQKVDHYVQYLYPFGDMTILQSMVEAYSYGNQDKLLDAMKKYTGADGIHWNMREGLDQFVVFDSSQFKDSAPVTYDDQGNVIPLSERFNDKTKDMRFSLPENYSVDGTIEYLPDGKVKSHMFGKEGMTFDNELEARYSITDDAVQLSIFDEEYQKEVFENRDEQENKYIDARNQYIKYLTENLKTERGSRVLYNSLEGRRIVLEYFPFLTDVNANRDEVEAFFKTFKTIKEFDELSGYGVVFRDNRENLAEIYKEAQKRIDEITNQNCKTKVEDRELSFEITRKKISVDQAEELYHYYKTSDDLDYLAEHVFKICRRGYVEFYLSTVLKTSSGDASSYRVRYDVNTLNSPFALSYQKANVILHEAIHIATNFLLTGYEYGLVRGGRFNDVPTVADVLKKVIDKVKKSPFGKRFGDHWYGLVDKEELLAELSNPMFRIALSNVKATKEYATAMSLFLSDMEVVPDNMLDVVERCLEELLDMPYYMAANVQKEYMLKGESFYKGTDHFRYSMPSDEDYMKAVNDKDMKLVGELVEQAARANGYDSPKLYHGTDKFGFTTVNYSEGDDGFSFWATDDEKIAASYVEDGAVKSIGKPKDIYKLSEPIETFVNYLNNPVNYLAYLNEGWGRWLGLPKYRLLDQEYIDKQVSARMSSLKSRIKGVFSNADFLDDVLNAKTAKELIKVYKDSVEKRVQFALGGNNASFDSIISDFKELVEWSKATVKNSVIDAKEEENGYTVLVPKTQLYEQYLTYSRAATNGIYQFYAKVNNALRIDCKGSRWNRIPTPNIKGLGSISSTREIANWALKNGYDMVIFKEVVDIGNQAYGETREKLKPATVYAFLNENNSIKSADPVTYDDEGNVIPLSERFNPDNNDIRWSLPEDDLKEAKRIKKLAEQQSERATERLQKSRKLVQDNTAANKATNRVLDLAQKLKEYVTKRKYVSSSVLANPLLDAWAKELGKLKYRSDIRKASARKILVGFSQFYNKNNDVLTDYYKSMNQEMDANVLGALELLKNNIADKNVNFKPLSLEELQAAEVILGAADALFRNFDTVVIDGKRELTHTLAEQEIEILQSGDPKEYKKFVKAMLLAQKYLNNATDPRAVIKWLEHYDENGILTKLFKSITDGETASMKQNVVFMTPFEDFLKKHKKYNKRLAETKITLDAIGGQVNLTVGQAIALYELTKREQAQRGLVESGVSFADDNGLTKSARFFGEGKYSEEEIKKYAEQIRDKVAQHLTAEDMEFIGLVEDFFNNQSKAVKTEADMELYGYTNALEEFYYPIKRAASTIATSFSNVQSLMADIAAMNTFSFNKDTVKNARNQLYLNSVYDTVQQHARLMSVYANMYKALEAFSRVMNRNIGTSTEVTSVRKYLQEHVWADSETYLKKLMADIQGIKNEQLGDKLWGGLRGAFAKAQLGANLKVIFAQTASLPTAMTRLSPSSIAYGITHKVNFKDLDQYSDWAMVRNHEQAIVKAEGVVDKVGKVGDMLSKPIQWTDRLTIGLLWNACQAEVKKTKGLEIGTEENKIEAAKLLESVGRDTQPNYTNTERSGMMRGNQFLKTLTMFTSAPLKQVSRFLEAAGEFSYALKTKNKTKIHVAGKKLRKTLAAILLANMMYCLIGQFFTWLYKKDRKNKAGEEISFAQDYFTDVAGTTIGMFPVAKSVFDYFNKGYDLSSFDFDIINDILNTTGDIVGLVEKAASGEHVERSDFGSALRTTVYSASQLAGIPTKNVMNTVTGLFKRFDPEVAYGLDSFFYGQDYRKDLNAYVTEGNEKMSNLLMDLYTKENTGTMSKDAQKTLLNLYTQGYDVLQKSIGNKISYSYKDENGDTQTESFTLNAQQKKQFKAIYSEATPVIEAMLDSKAFQKLSEENQAKAIRSVNNAYYIKAKNAVTETATDNSLLMYFPKDTGKYATILAGLSDVTADTDKKGNVINGTKKQNVYKYLTGNGLTKNEALYVMAVKGYSLKNLPVSEANARKMLLKYILSLPVSQSEKAAIAEHCGFTVKGNRIISKTG